MEQKNPQPEASARLRSLLKEAGLVSFRVDSLRRGLSYRGRSREWLIVAALTADWLHIYTLVCNTPEEAGLRARLFETTMCANTTMTLAKFATPAQGLVLEIDYRAEHLDAMVLRNLLGHLYWVAEEHYPKVFRIVSGDETLQALESTLSTSEAA
jgi:hypothetical protein